MNDLRFHTTHWTEIMGSRRLEYLCTAYREPVIHFVQKIVRDDNRAQYGGRDASDVTQDFFVRILQGKEFQKLQRDRGRFRVYLLGAVKFFLADLRSRESAQKRGGKSRPILIEPTEWENIPDRFDSSFDADWAATLIGRTIAELRTEAVRQDREEQFDVLRHWLTGDGGELNRAEACRRLDVSVEHFKVMVSRLRKKFRAAVRNQIAPTVESEAEIGPELDDLIRALSANRSSLDR